VPHVGDVGEGRGRMKKALRKTVGDGGDTITKYKSLWII